MVVLQLPDARTGQLVSLSDVKGEKGVLVMVISNHCPFVVILKKEIANVGMEYQQKGVGVVAISSNSVQTHPQASLNSLIAQFLTPKPDSWRAKRCPETLVKVHAGWACSYGKRCRNE